MTDLPKDAFRALTYVPGEDRPGEWVTTETLTRLLTHLYGPIVGEATPRLLRTLRTRSMVISRAGAYRRTPTGTTVLENRGRNKGDST